MAERADIFSHIAEDRMTVEQLIFRRNGRLHAISEAKRSGPRDVVVKAHQAYLKTQSMLAFRSTPQKG
jgi:hypothetical protein